MQLKGIPPSSVELAEEMKITKEEIDELLSCELRSITVSLQGTVKSKSDPSELVDILPSDQIAPMELAELSERTASAWKLLDKANLTEKERKIVSLRFGLDGSNEWRTLAEVARHMSCSREYCRQVVQRALRKLRKAGIQNGLVDILPSDQIPPMELAELAERTASAWKLLDKANLTEKERKIVSLRFGLDGSNEWRTLAEVARHMSCSREYCRQVVQRALRKLRKAGIQNGLVDSIS